MGVQSTALTNDINLMLQPVVQNATRPLPYMHRRIHWKMTFFVCIFSTAEGIDPLNLGSSPNNVVSLLVN